MTKRAQIIFGSVIVALIVLALAVNYARSHGILRFDGWEPRFSIEALKNPRPSIDRKVNYSVDLSQEARALVDKKLEETREKLRKDPANVGAWFDLAIYYRTAGDYEGAVQIWKYVSAQYPTEGISLHNLGEYYFHTKKDYPTAEEYYLKSIAVAPKLSQNYLDLFDMYRYVYKTDTTAAVDILNKGIPEVAAQEALGMAANLGAYFKEKGNTTEARKYYTEARGIAKILGNTAVMNQMNAELSKLK